MNYAVVLKRQNIVILSKVTSQGRVRDKVIWEAVCEMVQNPIEITGN